MLTLLVLLYKIKCFHNPSESMPRFLLRVLLLYSLCCSLGASILYMILLRFSVDWTEVNGMGEPVSLKDVPGVGPATASKLRQVGITTIEALAVTPIREITDKTDIGFEKALQIILEARKLVQADWTTAKELWKRRKGMLRCSTVSQKLDALLADGISSERVYRTAAAMGLDP
jgi:hypothetical protein